MDFNQIMNGGLLYALVIIGLLTIVAYIIVTFRRAWKRAMEMGIDRAKLNVVMSSSALFSIVPSLSIVVGLISLSAVLGIPWSWFRLSVIGSLNYELTSAGLIATASGFENLAALGASGDTSLIGAIMIAMSLCILPGLFVLLFFGKPIQTSLLKMESSHPETGALMIACCVLSLVVIYFPSMMLGGPVKALTFITSAVIAALHLYVIKKFNIAWLANFTLCDTLILSMICSVFYTNMFA